MECENWLEKGLRVVAGVIQICWLSCWDISIYIRNKLIELSSQVLWTPHMNFISNKWTHEIEGFIGRAVRCQCLGYPSCWDRKSFCAVSHRWCPGKPSGPDCLQVKRQSRGETSWLVWLSGSGWPEWHRTSQQAKMDGLAWPGAQASSRLEAIHVTVDDHRCKLYSVKDGRPWFKTRKDSWGS